MRKGIRKLFGGISLTWPKLIICAIIAGVYTAAVAIIPALHYTSFHTITVTLERYLPFETGSPNTESRAAIAEADKILNSHGARFHTASELFNDIEKNISG